MTGSVVKVERLACLELRGGNHLTTYAARLPGLSAWVSCNPLRPSTRGGDLYYLSACSHGSIARVVIADVSGHGEKVSAAAARLQNSAAAIHRSLGSVAVDPRPQRIVLPERAPRQVRHRLSGQLRVPIGDLLFTNAGHMLPLWYRAASQKWTYLQDFMPAPKTISDLPLGLIPGTEYHQTAARLGPGDLLILYTDGINEAENEAGDQLGLACLLSMARSLPTNSPTAAGEALMAAVSRFRGAAPAKDDATVVALRCEAVA